jgi:hypothetical protein
MIAEPKRTKQSSGMVSHLFVLELANPRLTPLEITCKSLTPSKGSIFKKGVPVPMMLPTVASPSLGSDNLPKEDPLPIKLPIKGPPEMLPFDIFMPIAWIGPDKVTGSDVITVVEVGRDIQTFPDPEFAGLMVPVPVIVPPPKE